MSEIYISQRTPRTPRWAVAAIAGVTLAVHAAGAAVVFQDTFGSSTLNGASNPTATSTSYDVASTKNQSPAASIAAGHLKLGMASSGSAVEEAQALFTTAPVVLITPGDSIQYALTFTDTTGLLAGGTSSVIYVGLYDSGGNLPAVGLQSTGLNTTSASTFSTGNAALWQGYSTRIAQSGGTNQVYTRPQQIGTGTASANQDLVGNGAGGGLYNNPAGALIGGNGFASTVTLTAASVYTDALTITLNADGTLELSSNLFAGAGTGGTNLATETVSSQAASTIATSFDGLAFGWRQSGTSIATGMDVNAITVSANIQPVPEPAAIVGLGVPAVLGSARRRRA
jgi:hypothetical protein